MFFHVLLGLLMYVCTLFFAFDVLEKIIVIFLILVGVEISFKIMDRVSSIVEGIICLGWLFVDLYLIDGSCSPKLLDQYF